LTAHVRSIVLDSMHSLRWQTQKRY
jgi:hypothetical protein